MRVLRAVLLFPFKVLRAIFRFIFGPNFMRDRPADSSVLTRGPLDGSERVIASDSTEGGQDAAADVRRRGNVFGR